MKINRKRRRKDAVKKELFRSLQERIVRNGRKEESVSLLSGHKVIVF